MKSFFKPDPEVRNWKLYVVDKGGKRYVGITPKKDAMSRIRQHGTRNGSAWMRMFRDQPTRVVEIKDLGKIPRQRAEYIENKETIKHMRKLGKRNVRGGFNVKTGPLLLPQYNPGSYQDILQIVGIAFVLFVLIFIVVR